MAGDGHPFSTCELRRFGRFLAVGALGTALDFGLLAALKLAGLPTLLANSLSFSAGVLNNYVGNRRWTFADRPRRPWRSQLAQFALVSLVGLALNNLIVLSFEGILAWPGVPGYLPAKVLATGVVVFWNYLANRCWTFAPAAAPAPAARQAHAEGLARSRSS